MPSDDQIPYAEALAELESILAALEDESTDVDLLTTRVARAADLIRICRDRIGSAQMEVERIVSEMEEG
jgi:exodeoxyribonuclease VII small subunit